MTQTEQLSPMQRLALIRKGEAILAGRKGDPALHLQLGTLYKAERQMEPAIRHLLIANKAMKKDPVAIGQLAEAYITIRDYRAAKKYVRRLVELQPRNENTLVFYAEFLVKAGLMQQAAEAWQKITSLFPNNPGNWRDLATCYGTLAKWDEAKASLKKALELDPLDPLTLYQVVNTGKTAKEDARKLLESIRKSIERADHPVDKASLYYSAGKLNTELGEIDTAMADYASANALRETEGGEEIHERMLTNIRASYTKEFIRKHAHSGSQSDAPIFVLGMPRSGTTLVESLIGGHSLVTAGDELGYIRNIANRFGIQRSEKVAIQRMLDHMKPENVKELADEYLDATRSIHPGTPYFTDKLPHNFQHIGLIRMLFPNAHIIHCRRHPLDNCLSLYTNSMTEFHNAYKHDLRKLGLYYRQYLRLMEHWRQAVPGGFHEVYYEDVVANTELNARSMIEYLGLEWEDGVMAREGSQTSVKTLSVWQVRQPIYTSSAGRWKKFEAHLGPLIEALGSEVGRYEDELAALASANNGD